MRAQQRFTARVQSQAAADRDSGSYPASCSVSALQEPNAAEQLPSLAMAPALGPGSLLWHAPSEAHLQPPVAHDSLLPEGPVVHPVKVDSTCSTAATVAKSLYPSAQTSAFSSLQQVNALHSRYCCCVLLAARCLCNARMYGIQLEHHHCSLCAAAAVQAIVWQAKCMHDGVCTKPKL